jgi:hypothetical protein
MFYFSTDFPQIASKIIPKTEKLREERAARGARSPPPLGGQGAPKEPPRTRLTRPTDNQRRLVGRARVGGGGGCPTSPD